MLSQLLVSPHCDVGQVRSGVMGRVYTATFTNFSQLHFCYSLSLLKVFFGTSAIRTFHLVEQDFLLFPWAFWISSIVAKCRILLWFIRTCETLSTKSGIVGNKGGAGCWLLLTLQIGLDKPKGIVSCCFIYTKTSYKLRYMFYNI